MADWKTHPMLTLYEVRVPQTGSGQLIPRHHGHPSVKLTTTSTFVAQDFHPIDYTHVGYTVKKTTITSSRSVD